MKLKNKIEIEIEVDNHDVSKCGNACIFFCEDRVIEWHYFSDSQEYATLCFLFNCELYETVNLEGYNRCDACIKAFPITEET